MRDLQNDIMNNQIESRKEVQPEVSIVIPIYNEQEVLPQLIARLRDIVHNSAFQIEIVLVDDGSHDHSPSMIKKACSGEASFRGIILSRNFGHQIAVSAGLTEARGSQAVMVIDGDLQDPPELIHQFYEKLKEGHDVVYAVRKQRKEGAVKRFGYYFFYRLLKEISYIKLPIDSGDFCIMSRRAVDVLNSMPEESRYIRGMRAWIGFSQEGLEYKRQERAAGKPKYSFKMLFNLAYNGIYNFSRFPIKAIYYVGAFGIFSSILYLIYIVYRLLTTDLVPSGFATTIFVIVIFGSMNLFALGVLGEYIIRIFFQSKQRPLFIIKEKIE